MLGSGAITGAGGALTGVVSTGAASETGEATGAPAVIEVIAAGVEPGIMVIGVITEAPAVPPACVLKGAACVSRAPGAAGAAAPATAGAAFSIIELLPAALASDTGETSAV